MNSKEELKNLRAILKIEKEEDLNQYRKMVQETNVQERVKSGVSWYPIKVTQTGIGRGEQIFVEVERTNNLEIEHQLQSGKRGTLFCNIDNRANEQRAEGVIAMATKTHLRIFLHQDELPEWIKDGKIGVDLLFDEGSYKEMDETLRLVSEAEHNRLAQLREILLGHKVAIFKENHIQINHPKLNESQNTAVNLILKAEDVAIVHGPPGTGKTTTFIQAIKQVVKQEKQVLVTAPSNTAVDLLAEKLSLEGLKVVRIGHPARVSERLLNLTLDNQIANHDYFADIKSIRKKAEEYRTMAFKYKRNFGKAEANQRKMLMDEAKQLKSEAIKLEDYIVGDLMSSAEVIACTLVGANNVNLRDKTFKTIFIDEAAQALEPACWVPITKAHRVIMAGDHWQLPPTVKSYEAAQKGLNVTLFEKTIKRQTVDVMLEVQYRMNEQIMNFSGEQFYKGKLIAHDIVKNIVISEHEAPLEFIDTAGCGFNEQYQHQRSVSNPEEGTLVLKHLANLLENIEYEGKSQIGIDLNIGIISPYKAQVAWLTENLNSQEILEKYKAFISINTVDGFQGQERDIMYISLVRSNDNQEIGFLSDTRRMNVALTRAKKKLVVVGDSATLASNAFYADFLNYVEKHEFHKSAWEYHG